MNIGVQVANNGGANAVCVAEHAMWLILTILHKFDRQIASLRAGRWAADVTGEREEFRTLVDKRIGIVGLGRIGSRVAKRLAGWECDVVYHDIAEFDADYERSTGARRIPLDELLATSDVVTLHVPLDRMTRHMISENRSWTRVATQFCRQDQQRRAHALAPGREDVLAKSHDQLGFTAQLLAHRALDQLERGSDAFEDGVDGRGRGCQRGVRHRRPA